MSSNKLFFHNKEINKFYNLSKKFVFRYAAPFKSLNDNIVKPFKINIDNLIDILRYNYNFKNNTSMILDVITSFSDIKCLTHTPLVIDFDIKDIDCIKSITNGYNYEEIVNDIDKVVKDILKCNFDCYYDNYDNDLFNFLLSIAKCNFNKCDDNDEFKIKSNKQTFNTFTTRIIQRKKKSEDIENETDLKLKVNDYNFHIIYPFVIINNNIKNKMYDKIKEELNKLSKYKNVDFEKIIDNHLSTNSLRIINSSKYQDKDMKGKYDIFNDQYFIDITLSDVNKNFYNTDWDNYEDSEFNSKILFYNLLLCSLQWSRCNLINDYTFKPKDKFVNDCKKEHNKQINKKEINTNKKNKRIKYKQKDKRYK